jgi:hypothetical protein
MAHAGCVPLQARRRLDQYLEFKGNTLFGSVSGEG